MIAILSTVIGIVFVMLLFSLLASTILELVAGLLSLRGKHLVKAIRGMVGEETTNEFIEHPFFQQLAAGSQERTKIGKTKTALPSYINANTFSAILLDIMNIDASTDVQARISALPDGPAKKLAEFLYKQSNGELHDLKAKVDEWYTEVMNRVSGAYKRNSQRWLVAIGLAVAVVFNVDVINVYHNLSINATLSNLVADQATTFVNTQPVPVAPNLNNPDIDAAKLKIGALVNDNIAALESPLGLGWDTAQFDQLNLKLLLYKLVGWITTALGISLGATFWFESLKKLVSLRAAGPAPVTSTAPAQQPALSRPEPDSGLESTRSAKKAKG